MPRLVRFLLVVLLLLRGPSHADEALFRSFLEVKKAYKEKRFDDAEAALRNVLELAAAPEREAELPRILPGYYFYAAAVAWARHDEERARTELGHYFEYQPNAAIDPSVYPKSYCLFFDAQRNEAQKLHPGPPNDIGLPDFANFAADETSIPLYRGDPAWVESAVRHLLTDAEKKAFANLADDESRREWVFRFWKKLDPDPATPENEFEVEFYRRVQYADAHFSTETIRGSVSDRGRTLIVMGPPSYVGKSTLTADSMTYLRTTKTVIVRSPRGMSLERVPTDSRSPTTPGGNEGEIERWYYRKDRISKGLPFQELEFTFYSREGYGVGVFQKDARELLALQRAVRLLRSGS